MNDVSPERLSVVVEREIAFPTEKIWRALTQPHLIEAWLMKNDFQPVVDHRFRLTADWGGIDCRVLTVEPNRVLAYTWWGFGLESVVTWTLTPTPTGTHLPRRSRRCWRGWIRAGRARSRRSLSALGGGEGRGEVGDSRESPARLEFTLASAPRNHRRPTSPQPSPPPGAEREWPPRHPARDFGTAAC